MKSHALILGKILILLCLSLWFGKPAYPQGALGAAPKNTSNASPFAMQAGFQIKLRTLYEPQVYQWLWLEGVSSEEGLSFFWVKGSPQETSFFGTSEEDSRPRGRVSLANWSDHATLWLPSFWPKAELFLANSSGLWISPRQYEILLNQKSLSPWIAPWSQGALPEDSVLQPMLQLAIQTLSYQLQEGQGATLAAPRLALKAKNEKYTVKVSGKETELEAITAEDLWARYTILKNPQNPLVLKVEFAPQTPIGTLLFSPLAWVKALLDYEVIELGFSRNY